MTTAAPIADRRIAPTARTMANARPAAGVEARPLSSAIALPRVEPAPRALLNRLYRRQPPWRLHIGPRAATLRWQWRADDELARRAGTGYALRLGSATGWLVLDEATQCALLGEREAARLPHELRCVLLSDALAEAIARLEQATRERFEWTLPHEAPPVTRAAWTAWFALAFDDAPGTAHRGFVALDDPAPLARLAAAGPAMDPQAPALGALRLPVALELGRTPIALRELRGIARGDIVAIERWRSDGRALVVVPRIGRGLRLAGGARVEGSRITLREDQGITMTPTDDTTLDAPPAATGLDRLDDMEVTLRFEVGELALPLRELRSLAPGHVFELDQPLDRSAVRIYAHGNLLGQGVLVAIGDKLGVRVAEFAADAHE